ncbi:MAG: glycosyltransferase [Hyphomicrobiaceae bacterium]
MRVLFIHQNFPAQFRYAAQTLTKRPDTDVLALTDSSNKQQIAGLNTGRYTAPKPPPPGMSRSAATLVHRFQRGEAVAVALVELKKRGFRPDVIVGHPGWGELMLVKEVFPDTPLIAHAEYYYAAEGGDVGFDPEFPGASDGLRINLKAKNIPLMAALLDSEVAVAPTAWQASRFPDELAGKIRTIHEGIRTDIACPKADATYDRGTGGRVFRAGDEVVTFVNRNLEPMRGFHIFMRALPGILEARPEAHAVIVGADGVSYGAAAPNGETWKSLFLGEVDARLPLDRVHFVGQVPYGDFISLMQVSRLHIYATYPFVLSWSMLEAMSSGALVLGSSTPPVTEMIEHGKNGLLYDFFDVDGLTRSAIAALADPAAYASIRADARRTIVERFDLGRVCLPAWLSLIETTAEGGRTTKGAVATAPSR